MAFDIYKNYEKGALVDSYTAQTGAAIVEGMMVKQDGTSGELVKADGTAGEFAMVAMRNQPTAWIDNSMKIPCFRGNCMFCTDKYVAHAYSYGDRLETSSGVPGSLKIYAPGTAPVVGRFCGYLTRDSVTYIIVDLCRC